MVKISDAEMEVMKIIWEKKETTSVEIIKELDEHNWSFNTIRTLIKRLYNKGAIKITDKESKLYKYAAAIDETQYKVGVAKDLIKRLYHGSFTEFVLQYCESDDVTQEELREIVKQIKELINEK